MKTVEEIKKEKEKLIKRMEQALTESCYQDYRELGAMVTIIDWVLEDNENDN